jgi:hypothetical protein
VANLTAYDTVVRRIEEKARHVARMLTLVNGYKIVLVKFERKRPLQRPRCTWEDNIKIDSKEIRFEGLD